MTQAQNLFELLATITLSILRLQVTILLALPILSLRGATLHSHQGFSKTSSAHIIPWLPITYEIKI